MGPCKSAKSFRALKMTCAQISNRRLPKHKLSQNAKNLQSLLKFGLIEDNVAVFQ